MRKGTPSRAAPADRRLERRREAVSKIVGRDPARLDKADVARAAIESPAENHSDGVAAPALWMAVDTADSMIGHRTRRHEAFGWAAARVDDLVKLPASRLTALLLVCAALAMPDASPRRPA